MPNDEDIQDQFIAAVSPKLPSFWPTRVRVWFIRAEAEFNLRNITQDETKWSLVVAALDETTAGRILNLLEHPPATDKYRAIKDKLTATFSLSRRERATALLNIGELGDRRPSELMDEMLALLGDETKNFLFEELFLQKMPESI
ncbi:uncharacterized protein LOC131881066 [Tigriopus californicus]|uniref:uncharacterized protein LOC131881066 n=1 Tax=Tigriopus californicus TaxID=6832 RepID=UPI0027DA9418|nr:uncharacterized protein LOC131881066 [Tigriopus californicus]